MPLHGLMMVRAGRVFVHLARPLCPERGQPKIAPFGIQRQPDLPCADDFSRYSIAWQLCAPMNTEDVADTLKLAVVSIS